MRSREVWRALQISHPSNPPAEDPGFWEGQSPTNFKDQVQKGLMGHLQLPRTASLGSKGRRGSQGAWNLKRAHHCSLALPPPPAEPERGAGCRKPGKGPEARRPHSGAVITGTCPLPPPAPTLIKSFFPLLESPRALSAGVGATAGSCRQPHKKWGWEGRRGDWDYGLAKLQRGRPPAGG